jgi:7-cyano-7-deazaguanine synthase in queuosine biosynthesis
MKSLLLISGGVDSTYCLWKELSTTSNDVTAVFLNSRNNDNLNKATNLSAFCGGPINKANEISCNNIVDWLRKNVRDFNFINHQIDNSYFKKNASSSDNPLTYAVRYFINDLNNGIYDQFIFSYEKENDGYANGGNVNGVRQAASMPALIEFKELAKRGSIMFPLIDNDYCQSFANKELPSDLFNFTISCEKTPTGSNPYNFCGICKRCSKRKFLKMQEDLGKTPEQIRDFMKQQTFLSNGKYWSFKNWIQLYVPDADTPLVYDYWDVPQWPNSYTVPNS